VRDWRSAGGLASGGGSRRSRAKSSRLPRGGGSLFTFSLSFSLTAMFPPTSLFPVRYSGGVANLMRIRVRSMLRVPSVAASARLSGQHTSTRIVTMGKAVSIGLLGITAHAVLNPLHLDTHELDNVGTANVSNEPRGYISFAELRHHKSRSSLWILINGIVYDVTAILSSHPGGAGPLLKHAGSDATWAYHPCTQL